MSPHCSLSVNQSFKSHIFSYSHKGESPPWTTSSNHRNNRSLWWRNGCIPICHTVFVDFTNNCHLWRPFWYDDSSLVHANPASLEADSVWWDRIGARCWVKGTFARSRPRPNNSWTRKYQVSSRFIVAYNNFLPPLLSQYSQRSF